jgi:DNA-binding MarR family transcriptional regulator
MVESIIEERRDLRGAAEPDPVELAARLRVVLLRTSRRLRHRGDTGLSPSLTNALIAVARRGPLTPSELADGERVKRPTATRFVSCLEEDGLVSREPDPDDGRSYRVSVTPRGAALLGSAACRKNAYLARGLGGLDGEELATLDRAAALLERLLDEEPR